MRRGFDVLDDESSVRTERLAQQAATSELLASQQGSVTIVQEVPITSGPTDASYVVLSASATLPNERVLTGTAAQITVTDGGAGGNVTLSLPSTITVATAYQIAGTQVVSSRKTGWTAWTGTNDRGTHATFSGTASAGYVQAELQAVMDSLKQVTEAYKALQADLISHGLIGT